MSTTVEHIAAKVRFCVQAMSAVTWLAGLMPDDHEKRLIARAVLVYLDAFLKLAPQLKNMLRASGADISHIQVQLGTLSTDYESYYDTIRDKLAAHRQEMGFAASIEAWNEVDFISTTVLFQDARQIYDAMAAAHADVEAFSELAGIRNEAVSNIVQAELGAVPKGVHVRSDSLAITRPQVATFVPTCDIQRQVHQVISIIDCLMFSSRLHKALSEWDDLQRLIRSLFVVDVINLTDNVFPRGHTSPGTSACLLEIARKDLTLSITGLENAAANRNLDAEERVRNVRNKIAAHIDAQELLDDLLKKLDTLASGDLAIVLTQAQTAFYEFCQANEMATLVLLHGRLLKGFDEVPSRFSKPF